MLSVLIDHIALEGKDATSCAVDRVVVRTYLAPVFHSLADSFLFFFPLPDQAHLSDENLR